MNIQRVRYVFGLLLFGLLCGLFAPTTIRAAGHSNDQYLIDRDVVNAGGGLSQSAAYSNTGSVGQTSPLGSSSNALHVVYAGFWHGKAFTLSIAKSGAGSGTVKDCVTAPDNCPGTRINCHDSGDKCSDFFAEGNAVNLYAFDDPDSDFAGWFLDGVPIIGPIYITRDLVVTAAFTKKPDTDADGLSDEWKEIIIDADPADGITTISQVGPSHDFDNDGLTNYEEFWNETDPTATTEIIADITPVDVAGTTQLTEVQRLTPFRMNVQLRIRSDNRPAKLVRDVTVMASNGGKFETSQIHLGSLFQGSVFPGRIYARTNTDGKFSVDVQGISEGSIQFTVEQIQGGAGVILPPFELLSPVNTPFMTAVWKGRQLIFPSGQNTIQIRIANLAALVYNLSQSANSAWELGGLTFEYVTISQQGYILLGQQAPLPNSSLDWQTVPNGLIAPFLDDLIVKPESRVYVNWDWLTEPYFVVEWSHMGHVSVPDADLTFQIQIWQRSKQVRFVYYNLFDSTNHPVNWPTAAVGMKFAANQIFTWDESPTSYSSLEVLDTTAPTVSVWALDSDHDRLFKDEEAILGTNPDNWDSDFDRMSDGWENTFSPYINPLQADADEDADGDGYLNIIEYFYFVTL